MDLNGEHCHQLEYSEALVLAKANKLNLMKISGSIFKLVDIGKLKYLKKKELSKQRLASKIVTKHIEFRSNIGDNDFEIKLKAICQFCKKGYRINIIAKYLHNTTTLEVYNNFVEKLCYRLNSYNNCINSNKTDRGDYIFHLNY